MMKKLQSTHTIRKTIVSAMVASALVFPLFASASIPNSSGVSASQAFGDLDLNDARDQAALFELLVDASREICGSTNIHVTGSVRRVSANEDCFRETLEIAVERVNNPAITELYLN